MDLNTENSFYDMSDEELAIIENNIEKMFSGEEVKKADEILKEKGFLPRNEGFHSETPLPQETVEQNPRHYIIEECIPACLELWSKNIYTYIVTDHEDNFCGIQLCFLSEENRKIGMSINDGTEFAANHSMIYVNYFGERAQKDLLKLAKQFKMQDVQKYDAYISIKDFLMNYCNCYDEVPNPNYFYMEPPNISVEFTNECIEYFDKYDKWKDSINSKKTLRIYNPNKVTKPINELVKDYGMILEDDRVYLSEFHYNKHLNYLDWLQKENDNGEHIKYK